MEHAGIINKKWVLFDEEGTDGDQVYRPSAIPNRGRKSFELKEDGTFVQTGPAADDRHIVSEGRWEISNNTISLFSNTSSSSPTMLKISALDNEKLVLQK